MSGFNLAAWVMPGFGLLIGLFAVFMFASRWATRRRIMAPTTPVDPALRQRIENELKSE